MHQVRQQRRIVIIGCAGMPEAEFGGQPAAVRLDGAKQQWPPVMAVRVRAERRARFRQAILEKSTDEAVRRIAEFLLHHDVGTRDAAIRPQYDQRFPPSCRWRG